MNLIKEQISEKLFNLFSEWEQEYIYNWQHDTKNSEAWNALIKYLMELEKSQVEIDN